MPTTTTTTTTHTPSCMPPPNPPHARTHPRTRTHHASPPPIHPQLEAQTLPDPQPRIAVEGHAFAMQQLTEEGLSCYWLKIITRYADIYFST